jgi:hypothetical protein
MEEVCDLGKWEVECQDLVHPVWKGKGCQFHPVLQEQMVGKAEESQSQDESCGGRSYPRDSLPLVTSHSKPQCKGTQSNEELDLPSCTPLQ